MRIEEEYNNLLDSNIQHSQVMMGNLLTLCLTPGVVDACQAAAANKND
jgi:hypothetical protein